MDRAGIEQAVQAYFDALDSGAPATAAGLFAEDGVLVCESTHERFAGRPAIQGFFEAICAESRGMLHAPTNVVVDATRRTAAAELRYEDDLVDGRRYEMDNCNFFDLDEAGRFTRVRFWLGGDL